MLLSIIIAILATAVNGQLNESPFFRALDNCTRDLTIPAKRLEQYQLLVFPNDPETHCLIRCILVDLRAWQDHTGVTHSVLQQYFNPQDTPSNAYRRVQNCLAQVSVNCPAGDACARAYWSFNCYKKHFGSYFFSREQIVPSTAGQRRKNTLQCADKLAIPRQQIVEFVHRNRIDPRFGCFIRCTGLASGLYDDLTGLLLDRLYVTLGGQEQREVFLDRMYRAVESATVTTTERCAVAEQLTRPLQAMLFHVFGLTYRKRIPLSYHTKGLCD
ncbi:general odorant-binding protein 45-like [Malaya genurostris]|uniref:general odorant-binding protein 45-like n=1 Tax=Malaya genurostris TaxID=325434 RepID=UPI0026F3FF28|nr:general odorant-binding protein 45-like [Malaya genurostris]